MLAFDWANLGIAGAFVVGIVSGCVLSIRMLRVAVEVLRREREQ